MKKSGSDIAVCCESESLDILGTGGNIEVGKPNQWHNLYVCKKCKKVFYELADFGDVIQIFYSKKGTIRYQEDLVERERNRNPKYQPKITKLIKVNLFIPVRGGLKMGIKTLNGYRSYWMESPLDSLIYVTYQDLVEWGFDNIEEDDLWTIQSSYKSQLSDLNSKGSK